MLEIKNLQASINNKTILKGLNLTIKPGELHAMMGPNGSGKSTLAHVLSGKNGYEISGEINFRGENLKKVPVEERAQKGIFLAFQYPLEIPGVNTNNFLKTSLNSIRKSKGEKELDTLAFLKLVREKSSELGIDEKILSRQLNVGFSGGEKKKNEILQMKILNPNLTILDETDSGLDIDALKIIAEGIKNYRNKNRSFILITHYHRMLDFLNPNYVHILIDGEIALSGGPKLAKDLEQKGYSWIRERKAK